MNRIQQPLDEELGLSLLAPRPAESGTRVRRSNRELEGCHCFVPPLHYERNYAYPLVVWLHGPDDDERQVTRVMPHVSDRNYVAVGPRGAARAEAPGRGFCWPQNADAIELADERVMAAIAAARRWLNIAPGRVFLAGYAEGGTMAFRIALAKPRFFAGVLSFGGGLPTTLRPLAQVHAARRLNIFVATGREGRQYPQSAVCRDLRLLHAAGMPLCLRLYPCGDELTTRMLADMDRWIMEQVAPQPAAQGQTSGRLHGR
jgi:phospholipase/carboxylesterase